MTDKRAGRGLYHNTVSYFGGLVMVAAALLVVMATVFGVVFGETSPYLGIITYLLLPGAMLFGLVVFLYGMRRESLRRRRREAEAALYPRLDLNNPLQRRRFGYFLVGGTTIAIVLAFTGYRAFLFTESVTFCGRICHRVMQPEYTAYLYSPHARVPCVECHVGSGASWYVKSKLSGARQVFATLFDTFPRPIPVPIKNLRPARETCEQCHWPKKFYGAQLVQTPHFRFDEHNTAEQVTLLIKTGGGSSELGERAGIHWHMIIDNRVDFVALDRELQKIAEIRVTHRDGSTDTYYSRQHPMSPASQPVFAREMDCMDCHNRPTHIFRPPGIAVNEELAANRISRGLPSIKQVAVEALTKRYPSRRAAREGIRLEIVGFYRAKHPEVLKQAKAEVEQAAKAVVAIYERSDFPYMKVAPWTYASNIGHRNWPGCFRCHDGRHATRAGKVLTRDCSVCHTMPERGPLLPLGKLPPRPTADWHIWKLQGKHAELLCTRCHSAHVRPVESCAGCHRLSTTPPMMSSLGCGDCHLEEGKVKPLAPCKQCHTDLKGLHRKGGHPETACITCHHPHTWLVKGRALCLTCHPDKKDHYVDGGACINCHSFK